MKRKNRQAVDTIKRRRKSCHQIEQNCWKWAHFANDICSTYHVLYLKNWCVHHKKKTIECARKCMIRTLQNWIAIKLSHTPLTESYIIFFCFTINISQAKKSSSKIYNENEYNMDGKIVHLWFHDKFHGGYFLLLQNEQALNESISFVWFNWCSYFRLVSILFSKFRVVLVNQQTSNTNIQNRILMPNYAFEYNSFNIWMLTYACATIVFSHFDKTKIMQ